MTHPNTKPGEGLFLLREQAKVYGKRGGQAKQKYRICVEGENVTTEEIAKALGVSTRTAQDRLKRAQEKPGAVTWITLGRKQ